MPRKIYLKKKLLAILISRKNLDQKDRINFFTDSKLPFQVASMKHPNGHQIIPHKHNMFLRKIHLTSEVLFVLKGLIKVNFYKENKSIFKSINLKKGDLIIFFGGIHGFEIKKNSHFIEIKQGPYIKNIDKKIL